MRLIKYFILLLVLSNLFLVGCETETSESEEKAGEDTQTESEDTGISDVFEDTEEVNPPGTPT